jgi:hypothetical protein
MDGFQQISGLREHGHEPTRQQSAVDGEYLACQANGSRNRVGRVGLGPLRGLRARVGQAAIRRIDIRAGLGLRPVRPMACPGVPAGLRAPFARLLLEAAWIDDAVSRALERAWSAGAVRNGGSGSRSSRARSNSAARRSTAVLRLLRSHCGRVDP